MLWKTLESVYLSSYPHVDKCVHNSCFYPLFINSIIPLSFTKYGLDKKSAEIILIIKLT